MLTIPHRCVARIHINVKAVAELVKLKQKTLENAQTLSVIISYFRMRISNFIRKAEPTYTIRRKVMKATHLSHHSFKSKST